MGKQYHLGQVGTGSMSHDLNRFWHKVRGKEDPYLKVGDVNDRTVKGGAGIVWALKDINFNVNEGEVLGIIGKNGAGKSTLLKILSQITSPTVGEMKVKGRIAALLEVGTGFHPELTGKENIFLNGAILGMTKKEIKNKLDEIIDFSGVEKYLDTPVKRYSSGMLVRLGFAVAAHLEPEILIVDEVLAVGDAEFQKKCLGKMQDVAKNSGRTILFVSHNIGAVKELCTRAIYLKNGMLELSANVDEAINRYYDDFRKSAVQYINTKPKSEGFIKTYFCADDFNKPKEIFNFKENILVYLELGGKIDLKKISVGAAIKDKFGNKIFTTTTLCDIQKDKIVSYRLVIPKEFLLSGQYTIDLALFIPQGVVYDYVNDGAQFSVVDIDSELAIYGSADIGSVYTKCLWVNLN
ncbi:MAG TPA: ABC transporter ATP-binding protein [Bacteroidia bacterium]|nr:ABC transporter ATP-binding protein [Bacteroidia bacterium]